GGGQKANFSEATDRLEVVSWWVSPSEHPAFEVLLNTFKAANPKVNVIDGSIAGGGGSNVQVALLPVCGPAILPMYGRRSWAVRFVRGSTRNASQTCPPCTNARAWIRPCRRRCSTQRPIGSRRGGCRQGHTAGMFCGSTSGSCVRPALLFPVPATRRKPSATIWPKWRQAVKRRCAWAAKTGSPQRSCSRTLCSGWSAQTDGPRFTTTHSTGEDPNSDRH